MNPTASLEKISALKKFAIVVLLIYLAIYYGLLLLLRQDYIALASDLMSPVGIVLSLIMMFYAIQHHYSKQAKRIWIIFFLGTAAFLLGDIQSGYDELIRGISSFATTGDTYYMISGILILIGFFLHLPQKSIFSAIRSGFDVFILMIIYLSFEAKFILIPVMNNIELSNMEKFSSLMYPIFDVGLFIVIVLLFFNNANDKSYFKSKIMLVIACTWLLLDQTFSIMSILGTYQSGSLMDPLWATAFLGLSIVALRSAEFHLYPPVLLGSANQDIDQGITNRRIFLTYGIMFTFMILWCLEYIKRDPFSIGGIVIILLLILRQYFSLLENRRLMELLIQSNNDLQEAKTCIEYELRTDYLTRLFNRRYVDLALAELQRTARINSTPFSVLVMDIDHFKNINDLYGHGVGDQVLQQIAAIININIRRDDIAARWGGEEFVIILPETGEAIAYAIGERIRSEIAANHFTSDTGQENIKLSVSVGISEVDSFEQDFWKVLLRADQGMYEAKYAGRNRTVIKRVS